MSSLWKFGAGLTAAGGSVMALQSNSARNWDLSSLGIVRFGRAAMAVAVVIADYKWTLRGIDSQSEQYQQIQSRVHLRSAERLRAMCWRNGGCFIKVGQHIGALEYLVPREYTDTMKVLHRYAPESPISELQSVFHEDFGQGVDELFLEFDEKPVASASLAQVHRATRRSDGMTVAVKVQHPRVKAHAAVDMATMELLVDIVARVFPDFEFRWLAEETRKNLPLELNFKHEARNSEKAAQQFSHLEFLKVPAVDWSLTSERVLTMEFCQGGFITDLEYLCNNNISIHEVLDKLGKLYSEMIFVHGYIHCDPHPGNLFVSKAKNGAQIILLDHGLYQTLSDEVRLNYCHLWQSILRADVAQIKTHANKLGIERLYALFACVVTGRSWQAIQRGINKQKRTEAEAREIQTSAGAYIPEIISVLNSVPRQLLLIFKTNDLLRGIESSLQSSLAVRCRRYTETAFLTMARCCVRAVYKHNTVHCGTSRLCRWRYAAQKNWMLIQLSVYEMYLRLSDWFHTVTRRFRKNSLQIDIGDDTYS